MLKHDHDTTFNELLNDIEKWGSEHGFKLCQHPEPQVERDTEVYAKSQFDLELWRREGLKRDNFTNLLFHMIAKSDLANKARLRTVFPVECQVFDDWFKEGK